MSSGDFAQLGAVVGALGSVLVLTARTRALVTAGVAVLAAAEALFAVAVADGDFPSPRPGLVGAAVLGLAAVGGLAYVLVRWPAAVFPLVLATAPLRLPVDVGKEHALFVGFAKGGGLGRLYLLYAVLAAGTLALLWRAFRRRPLPAPPRYLAAPAAAVVAFACLSLLWSKDVDAGTNRLAYFLVPFGLLVAVLARAPFERWVPRALAATLVGLVTVFATIGIWQSWSHHLFFYAPKIKVANTYSSFFRVTSLFTDPSLYGRHLVLGLAVLLVLLLRRRIHWALGLGLIGLVWTGLYFSYSQSSMAALFVVTVFVGFVTAEKRTRRILVAAAVSTALVAGIALGTLARDESAQRFTSDRSRLVRITLDVWKEHPIVGAGIGAQPLASKEQVRGTADLGRYTSHTSPLTVLAELGLIGFAAYLALLAGAAWLFREVWRRDDVLGLSLAGVFLALLAHSLVYHGFFEDPITWGALGVAAAALAARREAEPSSDGTASLNGRPRRLPLLSRWTNTPSAETPAAR